MKNRTFKSTQQKMVAILLAYCVTGTPLWTQTQAAAPSSQQTSPQQASPQQASSQENAGYTFKATSDLVLVNVVARDKSGKAISGLKAEDFVVLEDKKQQTISSFDFENADQVPAQEGPTQATVFAAANNGPKPTNAAVQAASEALRDRRLLVLFFDLTSMAPEEVDRSVKAALNYVDRQMAPADLVSVVSLSSTLVVNQDFTSDKALLKKSIGRFSHTSAEGFAEGATGDAEGAADTNAAYTPDDTEYNIFNTDRKLQALKSVAQMLGGINQKKSIIYFSSGVSKTGVENQAELRAATNEAVRNNVSIYPMDARGLQALPPGGDASTASLRGVAAYSGRGVQNQFDSNFGTQETLTTLAGDTGGKAFLDSNDFTQVFKRVQADTGTYYVIGYRSSNPMKDGKYRHITVKPRNPELKLEHRSGYYANKDYKHFNKDDRELQLEQELSSELPATDVAVYLAAGYFRQRDGQFYVPVSLIVPGSQIPFTRNSDKDKATLDVIGMVKDELQRPIGNVRETVKLAVDESKQVKHKNIQYGTGFTLPAGKYHLKFVVRENESGKLGSFETDLELPIYKNIPLKMSSLLLGSQIDTAPRKNNKNPLIRDGGELVPNITHVFSASQHLYLYYEVYDPAREKRKAAAPTPASAPANAAQGGAAGPAKAESAAKPGSIKVMSNVAFYAGKVKYYETPLVEVKELNEPDRKAAVFQLDVPLQQLRPGFYTAQVNVVDDAGGTFLFPRVAMVIRK